MTSHLEKAESEKALGAVGAPKRFTIHTKAPGFRAGAQKKESILAAAEKSWKELGTDKVGLRFLFQ